jgi:hypothetical protein
MRVSIDERLLFGNEHFLSLSGSQEFYLVGGEYGTSVDDSPWMDVVEIFSSGSQSMQTAPLDRSAHRIHAAAAGLGRSIYICGGAIAEDPRLNSCLRFDVDTAEYVPVRPRKQSVSERETDRQTNREREREREREERGREGGRERERGKRAGCNIVYHK